MFSRSLKLVRTSWGVIKSDRELLWLPVISGLATLVAIALFLAPAVLTLQETTTASGATEHNIAPVGWVFLGLSYFVLAYIAIFFRTAMICAANQRLSGGDPTLGSALTDARKYAGRILPWAIVSATVSLILQAIEERAGFIGRIVIGLIGAAWSLITFLVLPVVIFEDLGVGSSIKKSASMFKATWGENMIGNGGIGLIAMLACIPGVVVAVFCIMSANAVLIVTGMVVGVAWCGLVVMVASAMTGVFQTALYRYATGQSTGPFETVTLQNAFRAKKSSGAFSRGL